MFSVGDWGQGSFSQKPGSNSSGSDIFRPARGQSPRVATLGGMFLSGKAFCWCPLLGGLEPPSATLSGL